MIKKFIIKRRQSQSAKRQIELIEYLSDKKTLEKAAEGSMKKRNDLIKRVDARVKHA